MNDPSLKNSIKIILLSRIRVKKLYHLIWHILHSFSVMYPENPTEEQKNQVKDFISKIKTHLILFCSSCSNNNKKDNFIEIYDIESAISSKINLILFFCEYHKYINLNLRNYEYEYTPNIFDVNFIINRYTDNDYISYIEDKYNINLYKMFQDNIMFSFFGIFNTNTKKICLNENYEFELIIKPN
jgi:hypothetical protein